MIDATRLRARYDALAARLGAAPAGRVGTLALCLLIGAEVLALATWLPDTFRIWQDPAHNGFGDFGHFYDNAKSLSLNNTYNPALAVVMHPLTLLSMPAAFRVYLALNMAAMLAVALIAQRGVASPAAKIAVVLGFLALPQAQWSLRTGHFTEILAIAALGGFLLTEKRPWIAGLCFAVLALKIQYLAVPMLYLLCTRNWRALASTTMALGALSLAGVAAIGIEQRSFVATYYVERVEFVVRDLLLGRSELLLPVQQSWQYSWSGFLNSAGIDPNPLVVAALFAVSLAVIALAWTRCEAATGRAVAAAGIVLLAPYATFYNWALLAVAGALLLHANIRPRWLTPAILVGVAAAAAATQNATPFPSQDAFAPAATRGLYWLQPAVLLSIGALAIAGRPSKVAATGSRAPMLVPTRRPTFAYAYATSAAACALVAGFYVAAFISHSGPFEPASYFGRGAAVRALPADFPVPEAAALGHAGEGSAFPYRVEWTTSGSVSDVAGAMTQRLADGSWRISGLTEARDGASAHLRAGRTASASAPAVAADVTVTQQPDGTSIIRLDFAPLPLDLIDGYDEWLLKQGVIVTNVAPEDYDKIR